MSDERDNYRRLWPAPVGVKLARPALAAAAREGRDGTARGEARQSGAKRNARKDDQ